MDERLIALALLTGVLVGLGQTTLGVGGGVVIVPLLTNFASFSPRAAVATSLATMAPVAFVNMARLLKLGLIEVGTSLRLGLTSIAGAWLAVRATGAVEPKVILYGFSLVCLAMSMQSLLRPPTERYDLSKKLDPPVGFLAGLVSGFTGVSGGVVTSPYLQRLARVPVASAVPTAVGALALTSLAGAITFAIENTSTAENLIRWPVVAVMFASALISSHFGIRFQGRIPQRVRLALLGTLLLGLSIQVFRRAWLL